MVNFTEVVNELTYTLRTIVSQQVQTWLQYKFWACIRHLRYTQSVLKQEDLHNSEI